MNKKKAIFFDRDGTLIIDKVYLNDPNQIEYLPGAFTALRSLRDAGFCFIVVTNQSGIAKGIVALENLELIHKRIVHDFAQNGVFFAGFYFAPHSVESNHHSRKPNPGMLELAARDHRIELSQSWMIGDRMTDVEAGRRAGAKTILLAGYERPSDSHFEKPTGFMPDLISTAEFIVGQ